MDNKSLSVKPNPSYDDKLFFLSEGLEADIYLDYGCKSGELLRELSLRCPNAVLYGYDEDKENIRIAKKKGIPYSTFSSNYMEMIEEISDLQDQGMTFGVILSSITHEIYAYKSGIQITDFWEDVCSVSADYIYFRDMALESIDQHGYTVNKYSQALNNTKAFINLNIISKFEKHWGSLYQFQNFIHFCLKYKYIDNWTKELPKNYLLDKDTIEMAFTDEYNYDIVFQKHYTLPHLKENIRKDLEFDFEVKTHLQLILQKPESEFDG